MDRQQALDGLELDEHAILDDDIESVATVDEDPLVRDRERSLAIEQKPPQLKLAAQARLVRRFEQARTEIPVHLDERTDDFLRAVRKPSLLLVFLFHTQNIDRHGLSLRELLAR